MKSTRNDAEIAEALDRFGRLINLTTEWAQENNISTNDFAFVAVLISGTYCGMKAKTMEDMDRLTGLLCRALHSQAGRVFEDTRKKRKAKP